MKFGIGFLSILFFPLFTLATKHVHLHAGFRYTQFLETLLSNPLPGDCQIKKLVELVRGTAKAVQLQIEHTKAENKPWKKAEIIFPDIPDNTILVRENTDIVDNKGRPLMKFSYISLEEWKVEGLLMEVIDLSIINPIQKTKIIKQLSFVQDDRGKIVFLKYSFQTPLGLRAEANYLGDDWQHTDWLVCQ